MRLPTGAGKSSTNVGTHGRAAFALTNRSVVSAVVEVVAPTLNGVTLA
jgi:hypothetical protein